ncbi:asparaginase [Aeromicrobium choanae]|uniref:Asparaginase n=1 Tax=Aeromicrobium choanae TaxID=1736691 RepID=A0A1T4Z7A2_9ACTN|nr:asparaginase [Aeromicrobium choanae]SKB09889.1 asparaginase [Aeromicrobium choanae]
MTTEAAFPDVSTRTAAPLAHVVRGDLVESVHLGHLVALAADGTPVLTLGDPEVTMWPRSSVKPFQAVAMVRHGLDLPERLMALAAASHNGEPDHIAGALAILARAGLDERALRNTPDLPWGTTAMRDWLESGQGPEQISQNCSGKHAAMLLTCVTAGWDTETYLAPDHPLQRAVRETIGELTGVPVTHETVDGCGAPLFATTVTGLARGFGRLAASPQQAPDSAEARVAHAMSTHPHMVAGGQRPTTTLMRAVPGLVAKDGADGIFAAGLPDGRAVAFKVLDGAERPLAPVLVTALDALGAFAGDGVDHEAVESLRERAVLGAGRAVGAIRAAF